MKYTRDEVEAIKNDMLKSLNICFGFDAFKFNEPNQEHLKSAEIKMNDLKSQGMRSENSPPPKSNRD